MIIRRAFYYWQFIAAVVLPVWLLVGWGISGGNGFQFLALVIGCPILAIVMLALAGLVVARRNVRAERAVSWFDVGALAVWHVVIIAAGTFGPSTSAFAVLAVLIAVGLFWLALWELLTDTRRRLTRVMDAFQVQAAAGSARQPAASAPPARDAFDPNRPQNGQTIRLD
ncbi:MAG: hypothetical protein ABI255_05265 [Microbacteriaceae bacterium]